MDSRFTLALRAVPDDELLRRLSDLAAQSRGVEADLVAHIGEVDERRLFARKAFPSMFAYCIECLHLSEAEAYRRITVARAARKHPEVLEALRDGRLQLSGLVRLVPLLTADNCEALLRRATHLTTRQIEVLVAELSPRPDVPSLIRKLPSVTPAGGSDPQKRLGPFPLAVEPQADTCPADRTPRPVDAEVPPRRPAELVARRVAGPPSERPGVVEPLSPARFKVQFTASAELREKLERLTALLRSEIPDGDLAAVIERAVTDNLTRLEARRFGKTSAPRTTPKDARSSGASRHIPAAVRRAVHERDGSRCRFVDDQGRRCSERTRLEFHHRHPFAMGGDHRPDNITLLCQQHNRRLAENDYGRGSIQRRMVVDREPPRAVDGERRRQHDSKAARIPETTRLLDDATPRQRES